MNSILFKEKSLSLTTIYKMAQLPTKCNFQLLLSEFFGGKTIKNLALLGGNI